MCFTSLVRDVGENNSGLGGLHVLCLQSQQWMRFEGSGWIPKIPEEQKGVLENVAIDCMEEHHRSPMKLLFEII